MIIKRPTEKQLLELSNLLTTVELGDKDILNSFFKSQATRAAILNFAETEYAGDLPVLLVGLVALLRDNNCLPDPKDESVEMEECVSPNFFDSLDDRE